ncbi:glycerophosphoryl diester phosphodiesterase [Nitzschia inconspicua]|uniref:Glycerophosphoryl diester phosphodiesterase n=1 Tax=Nitzschia inconspicua TaxID=303405 RepID=A0A9K3PSL6_9STRA|nr:glycerophosphoryl diester phosphodiesterase [Nitzschia inconspicua]
MKFTAVSSFLLLAVGFSAVVAQHSDYQPHYLVGLLNYDAVPDALKNHTSGTYIPFGEAQWSESTEVPFKDVPNVGFSDMEFYHDDTGAVVPGQFYCLSDNGFGTSDNSGDYPLNIHHLRIQKPFTFRHGESTFERYTPVELMEFALIHDPNELIQWENGADIQVTYKIPDDTWQDYRELRVLTGRDFDPEGLAVINQTCAMLGDEFMPAVFMVDPSTGIVLSPFVRTPDINEDGSLSTDMFLTTVRDKVHCSIEDLEEDACPSVASTLVDENIEYRKHDPSGGYEGFSVLADGSIVAFLEKTTGDTTLNDEPGVRVYKIIPGDCSVGSAPVFDSFMGYYPFEYGAENIADVSPIPGSSQYVVVIERNGFPNGHLFPGAGMPANKVCIVDLTSRDANMVFDKKKCVLNYHAIDDPWDVDGNGIFVYGHTQVTNEALIVVDDYCIVAGTDTNYPWTNQFNLEEDQMENWQETRDARFMVVCFQEPIFNTDMVSKYMSSGSSGGSGSSSSSSGSGTPNNDEIVVAQQENAGSRAMDSRSVRFMMFATAAASLALCLV